METDEFLLMVRETGARPIPLPEGRKAQRAGRKQGYVKAQARVLKTIFPTSLPGSLIPHLVQASIWQTDTNICKGNSNAILPLLALERVSSFSFSSTKLLLYYDLDFTYRLTLTLTQTQTLST